MITAAGLIANQRWLDAFKVGYPHRCRTKKDYPKPQDVRIRLPGLDFIRAPLAREAEWGFKTKTEMKAFLALYVAKNVSG